MSVSGYGGCPWRWRGAGASGALLEAAGALTAGPADQAGPMDPAGPAGPAVEGAWARSQAPRRPRSGMSHPGRDRRGILGG